jgi:hypothetical protein
MATRRLPWLQLRTVEVLEAPAPPDADRRTIALRACVVLVLVSATVFQRFGLNFGSYSLNAVMVAMYLLLGVAAVTGSLQVWLPRLVAYCVCMSAGLLSLLVNLNFAGASKTTVSSMALLLVMYFPFAFALKAPVATVVNVRWVLGALADVTLLCAIAAIAQFFVQFFVRPDWLFDFTPYLPEWLRGPGGYNTVIPIGSNYKSNGFFFREPSGASFAIAFGLLVELSLFGRVWRMACLALALAVTYSGTGLLALLIGLAFSIRPGSIARLAGPFTVIALGAWALEDSLDLSFTLDRIGEFGSEGSSAYIRYIGPVRLVADMLVAEPWSFWLGLGPGTVARLSQSAYQFHDPTWAKLLVEVGVTGFCAFVGLLLLSVRQAQIPIQLQVVLFASWLVMGGHLLSPENVHLAYTIAGFMVVASASSKECASETGENQPVTVKAHYDAT